MIKAVIFDLDNTLMDFMKMKSMSVDAAINGMIEAGLNIDFEESNESRKRIKLTAPIPKEFVDLEESLLCYEN